MTAIGIGIGIPFRYSSAAATVLSGAATLASGYDEALALDFTDMSAFVVDTGTPANDFDGDPNALLNYASPSQKWIRLQSGLWAADTTLRTEYDSAGDPQGLRVEESRTTLAAKPRRLDNATYWTPTNVSTSAVQGVDGVAGSATRISATAANATIIGTANTSASSARRLAPFVRRVAGTGNLEWTLDNGAIWTAFSGITSSFARIDVGATVANPRIGFRIVSSGDEFDIDFANGETGSFSTSPIDNPAATGTVTRAADNISLATSAFPASDSVGTVFVQYLRFEVAAEEPYVYDIGNVTDRASLLHSFDKPRVFATNGVSDVYTTGLIANVAAKHAFAWASNDAAHVLNGGTPETDATVTPPVIASKTMYLGQRYSNQFHLNGHIKKMLYLPRRMSNADMQTLTS